VLIITRGSPIYYSDKKWLTWDRGHGLAARRRLTVATDFKVYFCHL
jgi:IS30 family transposase